MEGDAEETPTPTRDSDQVGSLPLFQLTVQRILMLLNLTPPGWLGHVYVVHFPIG